MNRMFGKSPIGMLTATFCVIMLFGVLASWAVAGYLVAPQPMKVGNLPVDLVGENILLSSESGARISGWHIPAVDAQATIVLLHGIRASRYAMLERARFLVRENYDVLLIDFMAHGESSGEKITVGYRERYDVQAAVEFLKQRHPGKPIGVIGTSLGGAAALMGSPLEIQALVLEAVYPDIKRAVGNRVAEYLGCLAAVPTKLLMLQLRPRLGFFLPSYDLSIILQRLIARL